MPFKNISGERFGRLVAVERTGEKRWGVSIWKCACDCGEEHQAAVNSLRSGLVRSCGRLHRETARRTNTSHGHYGSPTYTSWDAMIQRCKNPNSTSYPRYGGVGVTVCDRWLVFPAFLEDMGERPPGTSIDRLDNSKGYEPGNCRWATATTQRRNQRRISMPAETVDEVLRLRAAHGWGPTQISAHLGVSRAAVNGVLYRNRSSRS